MSMKDVDEEEEFGSLMGNKDPNRQGNAAQDSSIPFCGCLSMSFYKPYFNVDTSDVTARLFMASFYCRKDDGFLALVGNNPDV